MKFLLIFFSAVSSALKCIAHMQHTLHEPAMSPSPHANWHTFTFTLPLPLKNRHSKTIFSTKVVRVYRWRRNRRRKKNRQTKFRAHFLCQLATRCSFKRFKLYRRIQHLLLAYSHHHHQLRGFAALFAFACLLATRVVLGLWAKRAAITRAPVR